VNLALGVAHVRRGERGVDATPLNACFAWERRAPERGGKREGSRERVTVAA
jgi:hypothetical protein